MRRLAWTLIRGAFPALAVASVIPLLLFYVTLLAGSIVWAIAISVAYAYGVGLYQYLRRGRISGMLIITMFMVTVRAVAAVLSGQVFVYFAVPVVETAGFGLMFMATMFSSEPLILRLARDVMPHAAENLARRRSLIRHLSLIWTVIYLGSGATTLALLTTLPLPVYLGAHQLTGWFWTGSGIVLSVLLCRRRAAGLLGETFLRPAAPPVAMSA